MATIKSRFDALPSSHDDHGQSLDGPWLTTYSRALCSIYPKDEDDCWDFLLSTQASSVFSKLPDHPAHLVHDLASTSTAGATLRLSSRRGTRSAQVVDKGDTVQSNWADFESASSAFYSSSPSGAAVPNLLRSAMTEEDLDHQVPLAPLSHALCNIGFSCIDLIDYFTATPEDLNNRLSAANTSSALDPAHRLDDINPDWRHSLAAAVSGKRTAALERKRVLSRSNSQADVVGSDPWFQTLDRLARWDEVAYR